MFVRLSVLVQPLDFLLKPEAPLPGPRFQSPTWPCWEEAAGREACRTGKRMLVYARLHVSTGFYVRTTSRDMTISPRSAPTLIKDKTGPPTGHQDAEVTGRGGLLLLLRRLRQPGLEGKDDSSPGSGSAHVAREAQGAAVVHTYQPIILFRVRIVSIFMKSGPAHRPA